MNTVAHGGPVLALLALMSVAAVTLVIVKIWEFFEHRIADTSMAESAVAAWHDGRAEHALQVLQPHPSPLAQVLAAAMQGLHGGLPESQVREYCAQLAAERLAAARGLFRPLEAIGQLAPLLGLLGTVLGMIEAFRRLEAAGDRVDPAILSGGIWEALLTTAAGLIVAIPTLAALHWLERRVERLHGAMEGALTRLFTPPLPPLLPARAAGVAAAR